MYASYLIMHIIDVLCVYVCAYMFPHFSVCVLVEGCQYVCVSVALVIVNMYIMHKY